MVIDSIVPLYEQVSNDIKKKINSGELKPGDRIGSITELMNQYSVSRVTAIASIDQLVKDGYALKRQGKGTFVRDGYTSDELTSLRSFQEITSRSSGNFSTKIIGFEVLPLDSELSDILGGESHGVQVKRLHFYKGRPIGFVEMMLPGSLSEKLSQRRDLLEQTSLLQTLSVLGYHIDSATQTISAAGANTEVALRLDLAEGAPILCAERTSFEKGGRAMMVSTFYYNPEYYSYKVNLRRTDLSLDVSF